MTAQNDVRALQSAFWQTTETLLYHHTNPWELDEALTAWGYGIGPCEAQDLVGLEQVLMSVPAWPGPVLPRMLAEGRMGKIGGVGFYRYPGGGGAVIDPLIEDLILEEAWFGKISRSELDDAALVKKLHAALAPVCKVLVDQGSTMDHVKQLLTNAVQFPAHRDLPI